MNFVNYGRLTILLIVAVVVTPTVTTAVAATLLSCSDLATPAPTRFYNPPASCIEQDAHVSSCTGTFTACVKGASSCAERFTQCLPAKLRCLEVAATKAKEDACLLWAADMQSMLLFLTGGVEYKFSALETSCHDSLCDPFLTNNGTFVANFTESCLSPPYAPSVCFSPVEVSFCRSLAQPSTNFYKPPVGCNNDTKIVACRTARDTCNTAATSCSKEMACQTNYSHCIQDVGTTSTGCALWQTMLDNEKLYLAAGGEYNASQLQLSCQHLVCDTEASSQHTCTPQDSEGVCAQRPLVPMPETDAPDTNPSIETYYVTVVISGSRQLFAEWLERATEEERRGVLERMMAAMLSWPQYMIRLTDAKAGSLIATFAVQGLSESQITSLLESAQSNDQSQYFLELAAATGIDVNTMALTSFSISSTTPSPRSTTPDTSGSSGLSLGVIIGVSVGGGLLVVGTLGFLVATFMRKSNHNTPPTTTIPSEEEEEDEEPLQIAPHAVGPKSPPVAAQPEPAVDGVQRVSVTNAVAPTQPQQETYPVPPAAPPILSPGQAFSQPQWVQNHPQQQPCNRGSFCTNPAPSHWQECHHPPLCSNHGASFPCGVGDRDHRMNFSHPPPEAVEVIRQALLGSPVAPQQQLSPTATTPTTTPVGVTPTTHQQPSSTASDSGSIQVESVTSPASPINQDRNHQADERQSSAASPIAAPASPLSEVDLPQQTREEDANGSQTTQVAQQRVNDAQQPPLSPAAISATGGGSAGSYTAFPSNPMLPPHLVTTPVAAVNTPSPSVGASGLGVPTPSGSMSPNPMWQQQQPVQSSSHSPSHASGVYPSASPLPNSTEDTTVVLPPNPHIALPAAEEQPTPPQQSRTHGDDEITTPNEGIPPARCFRRCPQLGFTEAVEALLSLPCPADRPDLERYVPDGDDTKSLLRFVEKSLPGVMSDPTVTQLVAEHDLTEDDVRALMAYKLEHPYPLYKWLNALLVSSRRDDVVSGAGPFFTLLFRAQEKLPKVTKKASRSVIVRNIPTLQRVFDTYNTELVKGKAVNFWGFSSFSTDDKVINSKAFMGSVEDRAIVYTCPDLTGVDMEPFKVVGAVSEAELLPLAPAMFKIVVATMVQKKLTVIIEQVDNDDDAYVVPAHLQQKAKQGDGSSLTHV